MQRGDFVLYLLDIDLPSFRCSCVQWRTQKYSKFDKWKLDNFQGLMKRWILFIMLGKLNNRWEIIENQLKQSAKSPQNIAWWKRFMQIFKTFCGQKRNEAKAREWNNWMISKTCYKRIITFVTTLTHFPIFHLPPHRFLLFRPFTSLISACRWILCFVKQWDMTERLSVIVEWSNSLDKR